jgi:crotonobetainyl-CoA:carnitine CoA-transferase CaiB-like acyl-CoA transferase
MTGYELMAPCLPEAQEERAHLAGLLPAGVLTSAGPERDAGSAAPCSVLAWARSGLMHLTGRPGGPPLAPAAPVLARAAAICAAIEELTSGRGAPVIIDPRRVLAERAALSRWQRRGTVSANGTCQILRAADGWLAVNLARPEDVRSLPAALGGELAGEPWAELRAAAAGRPAADLAAAAQLVGIPAAVLDSAPREPVRFSRLGPRGASPGLVLDLSAMWAGPLAASILGQAGWRVLKVEDSRRPDGARSGPAPFFTSLHAGSQTVQLDFGSPGGRAELARLAGLAGIVVEASRPRALRGLGLVAEDWLRAGPGRVWVSVTGYGRGAPERVAFGDDAAVAGHLVAYASGGTPVFCGDAIADPLTGLMAGLSALAGHTAGGGWLIDVAMAGVCADITRPSGRAWPHHVRPHGLGWVVSHGALAEQVRPP